jgi:hypothetical protein
MLLEKASTTYGFLVTQMLMQYHELYLKLLSSNIIEIVQSGSVAERKIKRKQTRPES